MWMKDITVTFSGVLSVQNTVHNGITYVYVLLIASFCHLQVMLLAGKDKGKIGIVKDIIKERNWVFVADLNCVRMHLKYFRKVHVHS